MSITFTKLLSDCLVAMGDETAATWDRTDTIWPWAIEGMLAFPILRPMTDDHTNGAVLVYSFDLPTDFREVITVEYPISQVPPSYLVRKNRLDPDFHNAAGYYDIDHNYASGEGWVCFVSKGLGANHHIRTNYLANHDTAMLDDSTVTITIPDEYENILVAYVLAKGFRERLSAYMITPTAHSSLIMQMTDMVRKAEDNYHLLVQRAQQKLADSRITPNVAVDKFDRVY